MSARTIQWRMVRLDQVAHVKAGQTPRGLDRLLTDRPRDDRTIPFYKVGDMNAHPTEMRISRTYLAEDEVAGLKLAVLPAGTSVFPKVGGAVLTNKKRTVVAPGAVDLNTMAVVPGAELDARYLAAWLQRLDLRTLVDGSVLPQISQARVRALVIPLPELREQRRITEMLDDHFSRLDAAGESLDRNSVRLLTLRLAHLRAGLDDLRGRGVETRPLGQVATTSLGKMLDSKRAVGVPTPYLRNINVRWGSFDTTDIKHVPLSEAERESLALSAGDLLICEGGEPGRCAVWSGSADLITFQKALHRVRVRPEVILPDFLAAVVECAVRTGEAGGFFTGTTIKHLPQERLRALSVPLPDLQTQQSLLASIRDTSERVSRLRAQLAVARARQAALRRALLDGAFAGRLTGHGSDLDRVGELVAASS